MDWFRSSKYNCILQEVFTTFAMLMIIDLYWYSLYHIGPILYFTRFKNTQVHQERRFSPISNLPFLQVIIKHFGTMLVWLNMERSKMEFSTGEWYLIQIRLNSKKRVNHTSNNKPANCVCKKLKSQAKAYISFAVYISFASVLLVLKYCSKWIIRLLKIQRT